MRKQLSQLVTVIGIVLGLAAAAAFMALMWPDIVSDHSALRTDVRIVAFTLVFASLIGLGVSLPFLWIADRIFVKQDNNPCSPSDSISFSKNESESRKSARVKS